MFKYRTITHKYDYPASSIYLNLLAFKIRLIIIPEKIYETLPEKTIEAIIQHEEGHLFHKHSIFRRKGYLQKELEADKYACSRGGKQGLWDVFSRRANGIKLIYQKCDNEEKKKKLEKEMFFLDERIKAIRNYGQ